MPSRVFRTRRLLPIRGNAFADQDLRNARAAERFHPEPPANPMTVYRAGRR
jgi:hypothetical protein